MFTESFDESSITRIKEIEETTNHDVKAVEYYIKELLAETMMKDVREFIHFGCTSEDINNLSYALMLKNGIEQIWIPEANKLIEMVMEKAEKYRSISILSHTHGQAATPTTMGKEMAVFVYRWKRQIEVLKKINYLGKFGGVVGNFNAQNIAYPDLNWFDIAKQFVDKLGLEFNPLTTQIEPHDYIVEYLNCISLFNSILLDFDRDIWMYISLGYYKQNMQENEVGSSTMPHKINPIDFETSEANIGLSNAINGHLASKLPISRLQRDLSDSSALRNIGVGIAYSLIAIKYTIKGVNKIEIDTNRTEKDLDNAWEVLGEAIQTVLRKCGHERPYELLKELTRGRTINKEIVYEFIEGLDIPTVEKEKLLELTPSKYVGIASSLVDSIK